MKKFNVLIICLIACWGAAEAVELDSQNRDPKYVETILERSRKIVDKLEINSKEKVDEVTKVLANRYFELNDIYEKRDAKLKTAKGSLEGEALAEAIRNAEQEKDAALYKSHFAFPANLSMWIDDKQIEAIKDGITYGVVGVTYKATLDMIPDLKDNEKKKIYAWLIEARELALDAESSNKKHEVFGKYKGRINNYLSKQGYNLVKERENWYKRMDKNKSKAE